MDDQMTLPLGGWQEDRSAEQETWRRVVGSFNLDVQSTSPASHLWLWRAASASGVTLAEGQAATKAEAQRKADHLAAAAAAAEDFFDRYDRGLVGEPIVGILNNPFVARAAVAAAPAPAPNKAARRKKDKRSARHTQRRR